MNTFCRRLVSALAVALCALAAYAGTVNPEAFTNALLRGVTGKNVYSVGEAAKFTLSLQDAESFAAETYVVKWSLFDDAGQTASGTEPLPFADNSFTLTAAAFTKPGFVRLDAYVEDTSGNRVRATDRSNIEVAFHGGIGADIDKIGVTVAEPSDFDAYWSSEIARLNAVPVEEMFCEDTGYSVNPAVKIYAVGVRCATRHTQPSSAQINDTTNVTGFLCVPVDTETKVPAQLEFRGYGVHTAETPTWWISADKIRFMVYAHGGDLNKGSEYRNTLYNNLRTQDSNGTWYEYGMNPEENADPNTAYFNGMVMRVLRAAQYVKEQAKAGGKCTMWDGTNLVSTGGSQGGLQATWLAALDHDVTLLDTHINWSCDIGCTTDGHKIIPTWRLQWAAGLGYYDEIHFAKRIPKTCKVNISRAALGDELCPPSGLAAFYNALDTEKSIRWVQGSTHGYEPPAPRQEFTFSTTAATTWTGGDGKWFDMANWSAGIPGSVTKVAFPSTGGTIDMGGVIREMGSIDGFVNNSSPLTFTAEDDGGLTLYASGDAICVGRVGHGSLVFDKGAYAIPNGNLRVGWYYSGWSSSLPPSTGRVEIVSADVQVKFLDVGIDHGYGILDMKGGSLTTTDSVLYVGRDGTGRAEISDGVLNPGNWLWIGQVAGSEGTVRVSGGEVKPNSGVVIGDNGKGTLELANGTYDSLKNIYMGWGATGEGVLRVARGAMLSGSSVEIGRAGGSQARVEVAGGAWIYNGGNLQIGVNADAVGEVVVSDDGSLENCNDIYVGNNGVGTLTIESGTVSCTYWLDLCRSTNTASRLNFNGGVLNVGLVNSSKGEADGPVFNWNGGTFKPNSVYDGILPASAMAIDVKAGGAIVDSNGKDRYIAHDLRGVGFFKKQGEGKVTLNGAVDLKRGFVVEQGTLEIASGKIAATTAVTPLKEISVAEDATLNLNGAEVYVQGYTVAGVAQATGDYSEWGGTIHVSAAGAPVAATWTNAAGDGDFANPANWTCHDSDGVAIWDALPTSTDTIVTIPYDGEFFDATGIQAKEIVWAFAGGETVDFRSIGASGDDYSFPEAIAVAGGTLKIASGLSSTLKMAEAWYDPSDAATLALDEDDNVVGIANKGYRGSEMDGVSHSTKPYVSDETADRVNGNRFLVFTNVVGFTSAGKIKSTADQARHMFAVSQRMETKKEDGSSLWEIHPIEIYGGSNYGRMKIEQYGWAYEYNVWADSAEESNHSFWFRPGFNNEEEVTAIGHLMAKGTVLGGESYVYQDGAFKLAGTTNECVALTANAGGVYVNYGMRDATPTSDGTRSSGRLGEALVYATDLTDGEIEMVRRYLAAKWLEGGAEMPAATTSIPALALANDSVVDFDGADAAIADITGAGTISNANVIVTGTITVVVDSDGTVDPLVVDGVLTLGANAKLVIKNARYLARNAVNAITAMGGVTGTFATVEAENGRLVRVRYENGVITVAKRGGICIVVK